MAEQNKKKFTEQEELQVIKQVLEFDFTRMSVSSMIALLVTMLDDHAELCDEDVELYMDDERQDLRHELSSHMYDYLLFSKSRQFELLGEQPIVYKLKKGAKRHE